MKNLLLAFIAFSSSLVYGQDYYSPTEKDKEPLARFPIDLSVSSSFPHRMVYNLPKELTGNVNQIVLDERSPQNSMVRNFSNANGSVIATCMGKVENPGCVVQHKGLSINKAAAHKAIETRFADPDLIAAAKEIHSSFSSGNEPIGFIGSLTRRTSKTEWLQPADAWIGYYQLDKKAATSVKIDFATGIYYIGSVNDPNYWQEHGRLSTINWTKYHASGVWTVNQGGSGWFDFTFNAESNKFEGTFADFGVDPQTGRQISPKSQGRWYGSKAAQ